MKNPQLIEQLKHANHLNRIQAIRKLVELDDFSSMEQLKAVYYNDEHPDVREEARLAGLKLRAQHEPSGFEGVPRPDRIPVTPPTDAQSQIKNTASITELVWQDLLLYILAFLIIATVGFNMTFTLFQNSLEAVLPELEASIATDPELSQVLNVDDLRAYADPSFGIIVSIISGIYMTLLFIGECYIINYIATTSFKAQTHFFNFVREFTLVNIVVGIIFWGFSILFASEFGNNLLALTQETTSTNSSAFMSLALCGFPFAIIGFGVYQSRVIAKNYQITAWNSFICLIMGYGTVQFLSLTVLLFLT